MGLEYSLRFQHPGPKAVICVLERLTAFRKCGPTSSEFELRAAEVVRGMPDASLLVKDDGLVFCSNGGSGTLLLGEIVVRLVSEFGAVTVAELE